MNKKVILLVEDNPGDVELTIRALKSRHIINEIVVANDGIEALDFLNGRGKFSGRDASILPALTLLDLKMPKKSGLEVLKEIRADAKTKLMPVVILTSSKEEIDLLNGYKLGCNSYICKPVDWSNFSEAIHQLGLYWLVLNELPPTDSKSV